MTLGLSSPMRLTIGGNRQSDQRLALARAADVYYSTQFLTVGQQSIPNLGTLGGVATNGDSASVDARDFDVADGGPVTMAATEYLSAPSAHRPAFTATTGTFSCVVAAHPTTTSGSLWDARSGNTNGCGIYHSSGSLVAIVGGASANATRSVSGWTSGAARPAGFKVKDGQLYLWSAAGFTAGVSITGVGAITFAGPRVGAYAYGSVLPFTGTHALGAWGAHDWTTEQFALLADLLMEAL